jgi:hypothetical protein
MRLIPVCPQRVKKTGVEFVPVYTTAFYSPYPKVETTQVVVSGERQGNGKSVSNGCRVCLR